MLREGHRTSGTVQSTVPDRRSLLLDRYEPGIGRSNDRHDPAWRHLGGYVFPDRRGGNFAGHAPHRPRLWRCRPAPFLSRRHIPARHRQADLGVVVMRAILMALVAS